MKDITSKIVHSLNEAIDTNTPSVENEPVVGVNAPKQVHKCDDCADFYLVDEPANESICPDCGGEGHPYGDVVECDGGDPAKISSPRLDENDDEDEDNEELKSEAELLVTEGLKLLDRNDYRRFNEGYRPRSRVTSKGELEMIVESNGHVATAKRRMTSRQKSAYRLSENYVSVVNTVNTKKNEAIKARRQELMIKNESRAVKLEALRLLERQGAKYDFRKFNEGMTKFLRHRNIMESLRRINEDDEIGTSELDQMTPDEIGDQVNDVIKDTGLEIISNDVDIEGDTATVNVRVQDSDDVEVLGSEVQDVLQDVFDAPVEIVGPSEADGDKTVQDLAVIINPDSEMNESDEEGLMSEEDELNESDDIEAQVAANAEDPEPKISERIRSRRRRKNESLRRRRSFRRKNESFIEGVGDTPLFALVSNTTQGDKNNQPQFLGHDDSLVGGNEPDAEDRARTFTSYEAAEKYIQDAGIENDYTPVSISIEKNQANEGIEPNAEYPDIVNTDDRPGEAELDDEEKNIFETTEGTYFSEDEKYFKESEDGTVSEVDKSEFEDAKATASEIDKIEESFRRRNSRKARRRR